MVSLPEHAYNARQRSTLNDCSDDAVSESWDVSIQHLSDSLSQICRSPTRSQGCSLHDFPRGPPGYNHHSVDSSTLAWNVQNGQTLSSSLNDKHDHVVFSQSERHRKRVRVRHEESKRRLQEQLAVICGKSYSISSSLYSEERLKAPSRVTARHRPDINRDVLNGIFTVRVELGDARPQQICLKVVNDITVCSLPERCTSAFRVRRNSR